MSPTLPLYNSSLCLPTLLFDPYWSQVNPCVHQRPPCSTMLTCRRCRLDPLFVRRFTLFSESDSDLAGEVGPQCVIRLMWYMISSFIGRTSTQPYGLFLRRCEVMGASCYCTCTSTHDSKHIQTQCICHCPGARSSFKAHAHCIYPFLVVQHLQ